MEILKRNMKHKKRVIEITNIFGMKAAVAAQAMGVTVGVFRQKLSDKAPRNCFNNKNVEDLKKYIREKSNEIQDV